MCKLPAILIRLLAGLACLLACSCFDIREEVWISADGSGRAELTYVVPASAVKLAGGNEELEGKIRTAIARQHQLRLDGLQVSGEGDRVTVQVALSTDSVMSLRKLDDEGSMDDVPSAAVDLAGKFHVRMRGLDIDFTRTVRVKEALGLASLMIGREERRSRRIESILHLPVPVRESNATVIADGGKTLEWRSTLDDALKGPLVTRFKARMPVPKTVWFATALVVIAVAGLIWRIRIGKKNRKMAEQVEP